MRELETPLYLAKVDATANPKLSKQFEIRGFPTLKFFKNGNPMEYDAGRTKDDIVAFMKKKSGPVTVTYATAEELKTAIEAAPAVVVYFVEDIESESYKSWYAVMAGMDDVPAVYITDAAIAQEMGAEMNTIVLYKTMANAIPFTAPAEEYRKWLILNQLPLVVPFGQQFSRKLFDPEHGITAQLMFFAPEKNPGEAAIAVLEKIAAKYMGKMFIVHIPSENARLLDYFGLTADQIPALAMADFEGEGMKKYLFNGEITEEAVTAFAEDFFAGKLTPFLKSEEIPEEQVGAVMKLVGKNFEEIAYSPKKNVFVKFYAPWCGHCKALAPTYEQLAEAYKDDDSVIIAEIDSTANEVADINIRGFPTLKFFKAGGNGKAVVDFDGERNLDALKEFVEKNRIMVEKAEEEL